MGNVFVKSSGKELTPFWPANELDYISSLFHHYGDFIKFNNTALTDI